MNSAPGEQTELASVLFLDMVKFSTMPMEVQRAYLAEMQGVVREAPQFMRAEREKSLIALPTGDGMALVFFGDPTRVAECALEISAALKARTHLKVRMGLHNGPVYRVADINGSQNVSGGGINLCQRVMDAGDAGHILVSGSFAEVLRELGRWRPYLTYLGEHEIKHGSHMHFYNLFTEDAGNPQPPSKWYTRSAPPRPTPQTMESSVPVMPTAPVSVAPPPPPLAVPSAPERKRNLVFPVLAGVTTLAVVVFIAVKMNDKQAADYEPRSSVALPTPPVVLGEWSGGFNCRVRQHTIDMRFYDTPSGMKAHVLLRMSVQPCIGSPGT